MAVIRVVLLLWLCCLAGLAQAETRVALVIGNSRYTGVPQLPNPDRDADAVAKALREIGFEVQSEHDLGQAALLKALRRFESSANSADWALVYYAGHGIELGGVNYLVPVDAKLESDRDVEEEAVPLDRVLARLDGARKLRLVILDACRSNPFTAMKRTMATRAIGRGLGRIEPEAGTLVAYAAKAGSTASDGTSGAINSPYAAALVKHLATPDLEVDFFFRHVREDVLKATGRQQDPAFYGALPPQRFVLRPALATAERPSVQLPAQAPFPSPVEAVPPPVGALAAVPSPLLDTDRKQLIAACDRLAASSSDLDRPPDIKGVNSEAIDSGLAIPACRTAVEAGLNRPSDQSWYKRYIAARSEDTVSERRIQFQLGRALDAGKLYDKARSWYEKAAAAGSVAASSNLGVLYYHGKGVTQDYVEARRWYEKASVAGSAAALGNLGILYVYGEGVTQDYVEARRLFEKAAAAGEASSMVFLGALYADGQGVAKDHAEARRWFEKAVAAGSADAMVSLGALHANGLGVIEDLAEARRWYERGAALGSAYAMTELGSSYQSGGDIAAARSWFEKAAAAGNAEAMFKIGYFYEAGHGVMRDYGAARIWYEKAAAAGHKDAKPRSDRLPR